jgi:transcriptional regulator with XRE-family HTH domain
MKQVISKNFTRLVESSHLSQKALAKAVGVSETTIYRWKSGENTPEIDNLELVAKALNIHPVEFYRMEEQPYKPFAETLPVTRLLELLNKKVSRMDARIYDLSQRLSPDNEVWDVVAGILETAAHQEELEHYKKLAGRKD